MGGQAWGRSQIHYMKIKKWLQCQDGREPGWGAQLIGGIQMCLMLVDSPLSFSGKKKSRRGPSSPVLVV